MEGDDSKSEINADSTSNNTILSESFESWTVLSGINENKQKELHSEAVASHEDNEAEALEEGTDVIKEGLDDLSDGISVISDSENTDRSTPQPIVSSSSTDTAGSFSASAPSATEEYGEPLFILYKGQSEMKKGKKQGIISAQDEIVHHSFFQHIYEFRKTIIFYLSVFVAVIAFIGKLKCLEWNQLPLASDTSPFAQRIDDLELQNNLLRAEIDLLTKQVNYITQKKEKLKYKIEEKKLFKRGENVESDFVKDPINGGGEDSIETGFANLPFNHYYIKSEEKMLPQNEVNENNQQEAEVTAGSSKENQNCFEAKIPPTTSFAGEPGAELNKQMENIFHNEQEIVRAKGVGYKSQNDENVRQFSKETFNMDAEVSYKNKVNEPKHPRSPENERINKEFRKDDKSSEFKRKEYDKNNGFKKKDKKGEDYHKKWQKKERDKPYIKNDSGEDRRYSSGEDRKKIYEKYSQLSQDWHENLMKSREDFRKKQGKHDNNWYIERAHSREQARLPK